jgi:putative ABC transport system permease protein
VVIGLGAALASTRLLRGLLYDVSPTDPVILAGTCIVLFGITVLASWGPARRAAAIDPSDAMRRA